MELELAQLDVRYERLRIRHAASERRLLASLSESGQQLPILVVCNSDGGLDVVIDGHKRVRALRRLRSDTVRATRWELEEAEALIAVRQMGLSSGETALEQAWLLDELETRFGMDRQSLSRRFDRTPSWVSRRLALVRELPDSVQEAVRCGALAPYAALKYLVPLARANRTECEQFAAAIAPAGLTTRQVEQLHRAWCDGTEKTREQLRADPLLVLKALQEAQQPLDPRPLSPGEKLLRDLAQLGDVARRIDGRLRAGVARSLLPEDRVDARRCFAQSQSDFTRLERRIDREMGDVGRESTQCDPGAISSWSVDPQDRTGDEAVTANRAEGAPLRVDDATAAAEGRQSGAVP